MVFNITFNNISVILWWSVGGGKQVHRENYRPAESHWQTHFNVLFLYCCDLPIQDLDLFTKQWYTGFVSLTDLLGFCLPSQDIGFVYPKIVFMSCVPSQSQNLNLFFGHCSYAEITNQELDLFFFFWELVNAKFTKPELRLWFGSTTILCSNIWQKTCVQTAPLFA